MQIAQITDPHIVAGERGDANAARLERVVAHIVTLAPDLVLFTGDLTDDGSVDAYRRFAGIVAPLADRLAMTLGNHDRRDAFHLVFPEVPANEGFVQFARSLGDLRIVVLDTLHEGWETAGLCTARIDWVDAALAEQPTTATLLALHHPPAATGVPWIDAKANGCWSGRLAAVLARHPQVIGLAAGHVHRAVATQFAGRPLIVAASSAYEVAFDLRPVDPMRPDGRALIATGAPGYAVHQWRSGQLTTWFATAEDKEVIAHFDASTQNMITNLATEARTNDV